MTTLTENPGNYNPMSETEAIALLENCTGLIFTHNEHNGQVESKIGDWRVSISNFANDLTADPNKAKILCVTLVYPGHETKQEIVWKTGQQFATYSVRAGLLLICDWLIGFQAATGIGNK